MKCRGIRPNHVSNNLFSTFWTTIAFCTIMLFTIIFLIQSVTSSNNWFTTFMTFFCSKLKLILKNFDYHSLLDNAPKGVLSKREMIFLPLMWLHVTYYSGRMCLQVYLDVW